MQNSERDQFDHSWKSAFDGAEMTPSDRLWNSVEMELAGNETAVMKRRVVFYQRLAAATVLFALLSGAYAVYTYKDSSTQVASTQSQQPAVSQQPSAQQPSSSQLDAPKPPANVLAEGNAKEGVKSSQRSNSNSTSYGDITNSDALAALGNPLAANESDSVSDHEAASVPSAESFDGDTGLALTQVEDIDDKMLKEDEQPVKLLSADEINAIAEAENKKEKEKTDRSLWLGLGGAAGSYAPSTVVQGGSLMASADQVSFYSNTASQGIPQSFSETVGSAYSAGVSGGLRISDRWVVQSGLNYINQKVDYTTNYVGVSAANEAKVMTREYAAETNYDLFVTNPYEVSSATEILSIPAQIGFLIIDRKFGWQLNTGVSTDFLIRNTLTDKSGAKGKISEGAGENSPYRSVNGAALLNTELSYQIGNHYRLALVPGIRYSFKPMLKGSNEGTPLVLDIGFRFKYVFN